MKTKLMLTLAMATLWLASGCASSHSSALASAQTAYVPGYRPAPMYRPPTPILHYWAPSGIGAIQSGFMNRLR